MRRQRTEKNSRIKAITQLLTEVFKIIHVMSGLKRREQSHCPSQTSLNKMFKVSTDPSVRLMNITASLRQNYDCCCSNTFVENLKLIYFITEKC